MEVLDILGDKFTVQEFSVSSNRPTESSKDQPSSKWNINNNLLLCGFLIITDRNQVATTHPPDPTRDVEEQNPGCDKLTPVPLVTVNYQVWQPIRPTKQTLLPVVLEPSLRLLNRRLYRQRWGAVWGVKLQR